MFKWVLALLFASNAWAATFDFNLPIQENQKSVTGQGHLTWSDNLQSFIMEIGLKPHSFWYGVSLQKTPIRHNAFMRLGYSFNWQLANYLANETSLGLGYLDSKRSDKNSYLSFGEGLIGARNHLRLQIGKNTHLGFGGTVVESLLSQETKWDNAEYEAYFRHVLVSTEIEKWLIDLETSSKIYNPDRYFFVKKRDLLSFRTGPQFSGKFGQITLFGGAETEKFDNKPHKKILLLGSNIRFNISSQNLIQLRFGVSGNTINKTDSKVLSGTWENPKFNFEIYGLTQDGEIWQREKNIGAKLTLRIPNSIPKNRPLFSPEEYREPIKKSDFYAEHGFIDDPSLTLEQQANRLHTLRLRNEWSGQNLVYHHICAPLRWPIDVYDTRMGDCDDQAFLNSWIDRHNGYQAYLLSYWSTDKNVGHGVEIIQDSKTGRWFLDEYGIIQEILVAPDAPIETVALEALKQGTNFTALPIKNGSKIWYWVDSTVEDPRGYEWITDYIVVENFQSTAGKKPRIETGYELFAGPDALWK